MSAQLAQALRDIAYQRYLDLSVSEQSSLIRAAEALASHEAEQVLVALTAEQERLGMYDEAAPQHAGRADAQPVDTQAALDVLAERRRQISAEGWTPEHDDEHHQGSLSHAAAMYAVYGNVSYYGPGNPPSDWPWHADWWKPAASHRRNLVKAGALILAEIERLDRAAMLAARAEKGGT